ncbi:MAG: amidohydrolase family protein [Clostridia bacterium]|nr:amidohydrolase family protein [Clostridia bacterium]
MSEYIKIPKKFQAIDSHLHIHKLFEEERQMNFIDGHEWYKDSCGIKAINIASLPRNAGNNMAVALYKVANEQAFAHGCIVYPESPVNPNTIGNMDPLTQYKEMMEIGFDGIKFLEGKPEIYKRNWIPVDSDFYEPFWAEIEKDGTHVLAHINDPEFFWDGDKVSDELKAKGWFYGDGTYLPSEEMYKQIDNLLEKHPSLCLTLAHFYFCSAKPKKLVDMFNRYKNLAIDITPGGEMYVDFENNHDYYKDFFAKYSDRILFGTDGDFPRCVEAMRWLADRIYRFLATDERIMSFDNNLIEGILLPEHKVKQILSENFVRRVGTTPRVMNKKALKNYIDKYKHLIPTREDYQLIEDLCKKYL